MFQDFEIRELSLALKTSRQKIEKFLADNGLAFDSLDYYAGVFSGDTMLAGGGFCGNVMKCIAVAPEAREHNLTNMLVSHLRTVGYERGYDNIFVFTKPANEAIFTSLAFNIIGRAPEAILLESNPYGIEDYLKTLSSAKAGGRNGCIVMNCNPMTLGHLYLIETASKQVDRLHIILVKEDKSEFAYHDRLNMVREGTADIENVTVYEGGKYVISSATFPNYFLKNADSIARTQIQLDLDIFATHIAPALGAGVRFIGSEPYDALTSLYNKIMKSELPPRGIDVVEIERLESGSKYISATSVRELVSRFRLQDAFRLVPGTTKPYIIKKCAEILAGMATGSLREELETTPKPGLVDKDDNGAHNDMTLEMMQTSIDTLHPYFEQLAEIGLKAPGVPLDILSAEIRTAGIEAEKAMLAVTRGVNTHRGAIFSMGLCVVACSMLIAGGEDITPENISAEIARITQGFEKQENSKGAEVCRKYNVRGALENAQDGYSGLFSEVLPAYRKMKNQETDASLVNIKTLLLIMSVLDDTNIYSRKDGETAAQVKSYASELYNNSFDITKVREMNVHFIRENISPGGSADMLAIVIFLDKILTKYQ